MEKQRLDKFISNQTLISRSLVRTGIRRGQATVNGETVKDFSFIINPDFDKVTYQNVDVEYNKFIYVVMNKPKGVLSASSDKRQKTVLDLVPDNLRRPDLAPVGRLDKDTTGLIILTDDGEFSHNLLSPKKKVEKSYIAYLDGELTEEMINKFEEGITLADGEVCKSAKLEILKKNKARLILTEGKYHQVKRMFGVVGLGVNSLHRERIGKFTLPESLTAGECIAVSENDIKSFILT